MTASPSGGPASNPGGPEKDTWVSVALTVHGLRALGISEADLATFPAPFREGMAARAAKLGDAGESAPEHWEKPLGSTALHVVLTVTADLIVVLKDVLKRRRQAQRTPRHDALVWALFKRTRWATHPTR